MKNLADYLKEKGLLDRPVDSGRIRILEDVIGNIRNNAEKKTSENTEENIKAKIKKIMDSYEEYSVSLNENGVDLVIKKDGKVRVIFECKKPGSNEMLAVSNLDNKALHELILYYIEEYLRSQNKDNVDWLIATNGLEWFIFSKSSFLRNFAENPVFRDFIGIGTLFDIQKRNKKDIYVDIGNFLNDHPGALQQLDCLHIDANDEEFAKRLCLLLSPDILLKQFNPNIGNVLNKNFYNELLYIMGLKETSDKKIVSANVNGSFYQQVVMLLKSKNVPEEKIFESALDLLIIWFNRILFMKLFESRLISFNDGNVSFKFMDKGKIHDFSKMKQLFFQVLAVSEDERAINLQQFFKDIPYLNSSLFEPKEQESIVSISDISASDSVKYYQSTVLRDENTGKQRKGDVTLLDYLFDFLSAYGFGTEGRVNADLISPAVLGLIFEKINGYKEGSYYTPSDITDFMADKAIKDAIISKINTALNTSWETFEEFENAFFEGRIDKQIVSSILDSLKILDPAVGSAHFLVSALNVLLMIKWRFGFITDGNGQSFKALYDIETSNADLLYKEKETQKIFVYKKPKVKNEKQQEFQKTIFNTKKQIIEDNLFGVDINPKAVEIGRLRMWIELLKNAYYTEASNFNKIETLPNIDINIKEADSLLSPIADINTGMFKSASIPHYRELFTRYQNTSDKNEKQKIKEEMSEERNILKQDINITYDKLIWTVDFPQILSDDGQLIGFDIVIANPPYITFKGKKKVEVSKKYVDQLISLYPNSAEYKINSFALFIEKGINLTCKKGVLSYIIPSTIFQNEYLGKIRKYLLSKYYVQRIVCFEQKVFDAITDSIILVVINEPNIGQKTEVIKKEDTLFLPDDKKTYYLQHEWEQSEGAVINLKTNTADDEIISKIEKNSKILDLFLEANIGIKRAKAPIVNKPEKNYKKFLQGGDINKYRIIFDKKYILFRKSLFHTGVDEQIFLQPEKILIRKTGNLLLAAYDGEQYYTDQSIYNLYPKLGNKLNLKYILALLNSSLMNFYFNKKMITNPDIFPYIKGIHLKKLPLKDIDNAAQQPYINLVDQILAKKNSNPDADTSNLEHKIDELAYKLYGLADEEVKIIEE